MDAVLQATLTRQLEELRSSIAAGHAREMRFLVEREELRAVLAPLLDQWALHVGPTAICKICGASDLGSVPLVHTDNCPVLRCDELLGR